jgi:hypothetical protein
MKKLILVFLIILFLPFKSISQANLTLAFDCKVLVAPYWYSDSLCMVKKGKTITPLFYDKEESYFFVQRSNVFGWLPSTAFIYDENYYNAKQLLNVNKVHNIDEYFLFKNENAKRISKEEKESRQRWLNEEEVPLAKEKLEKEKELAENPSKVIYENCTSKFGLNWGYYKECSIKHLDNTMTTIYYLDGYYSLASGLVGALSYKTKEYAIASAYSRAKGWGASNEGLVSSLGSENLNSSSNDYDVIAQSDNSYLSVKTTESSSISIITNNNEDLNNNYSSKITAKDGTILYSFKNPNSGSSIDDDCGYISKKDFPVIVTIKYKQKQSGQWLSSSIRLFKGGIISLTP